MSHLKVLVCGINAYSFQLHGCIFMLCYTHLNLAFLLHKTVIVTFLLGSTVFSLRVARGLEYRLPSSTAIKSTHYVCTISGYCPLYYGAQKCPKAWVKWIRTAHCSLLAWEGYKKSAFVIFTWFWQNLVWSGFFAHYQHWQAWIIKFFTCRPKINPQKFSLCKIKI